MTDVITALNFMYVADQTAFEWVESLTLKKDWQSEGLKKAKNERKTLSQMKEFFAALLGRSNSLQENGTTAIHPPTHKYTYCTNSLESRRPDLLLCLVF